MAGMVESEADNDFPQTDDETMPPLFPRGVQVPSDLGQRIVTRSNTISKALLNNVQLDAYTLSSLVARSVITNEQAAMLNAETIPRSQRIYNFLRPALVDGGNSALERFYRCMIDTQEGRPGHEELAKHLKARVDQYIQHRQERRTRHKGQTHGNSARLQPTQHCFPTDMSSSETDDPLRPLTHKQLVKTKRLPSLVEKDKPVSTVPHEPVERATLSGGGVSKANSFPRDGKRQLHELDFRRSESFPPEQMKNASSSYVEESDDSHDADVESQSDLSIGGKLHVLCKTALSSNSQREDEPSSSDESTHPNSWKFSVSHAEKEKLRAFRCTSESILESVVEALITGKGTGRVSADYVSKLLFPREKPCDVISSLTRGHEFHVKDIAEAWVAKCLTSNDHVFDVSLALVSQPDIGRHLKCIADWMGACSRRDPMLSTFSKILGHSWNTLGLKLGFSELELTKPSNYSGKNSRKWFVENVWQVPKFESNKMKQLLVAALRMAGLEDKVLNFTNKFVQNEGLLSSVPDERTRTMAEIQDSMLTNDSTAAILATVGHHKKSSVTSETLTAAHILSSENECPPVLTTAGKKKSETFQTFSDGMKTGMTSINVSEPHERDTTSADSKAKIITGNPQIEPTLESFDGKRQVRRESSDSNVVNVSKPPSSVDWAVSSATLTPEADFPYDSDTTIFDDETYLYGEDYFQSPEAKVYDSSAILFGVDIVPPKIKRGSALSGLYDSMKAVPFDRELFSILLVSCPQISNLSDEDSRSTLFLACELNNAEAATLLLQHGANPNIQDNFGRTCLHLPGVYWNESLLMSLLSPSTGINTNIDTFEYHATPLCVACSSKEVSAVKKLLDHGADPNGHPEAVFPPLLIAARNGSLELVRLLLENNAKPDSQNKDGYTALHLAAFEGHQSTVELLLDSGCEVNCKAKNGSTPLNCAAVEGHHSILRLLLSRGGNANSIREFTADVQQTIMQQTVIQQAVVRQSTVSALCDAALGGHVGVVQILVEAGADTHFKSEDYLSVLAYACVGGSCDVVRCLMTTTHFGTDGKQLALPLRMAVEHENFRCARVMLDAAGGENLVLQQSRHDRQFVENVKAVYLCGEQDFHIYGNMIPKAVGKVDDDFQSYRPMFRSYLLEDIQVVEFIKPDELERYQMLVKYVSCRHIYTTAEILHGKDGLLQRASGRNELVDFINDASANRIAPGDFVYRMQYQGDQEIVTFLHQLVDLVHLQEYARQFDNRIALQYFQEMQRKQEMGIPAGMVVGGIAKTHPVSVRKSVTSQELYGMQSYQGSTGPGSQYKQLGNSSGVSHSVTKKDTPPTSLFGGTGQQLGSTPKESVTFDKKRTRNVKDEPIERPTKLKEQIHTASKDNTETETPSVPRVEDAVNKGKNKGQKQEKIPRGEKKSNEATSDTTFTSAANQSSKLITAIQADFSDSDEDDDKTPTVPIASKKESVKEWEYAIDLSRNEDQQLLDVVAQDGMVVKKLIPLIRRLRPFLPYEYVEKVRRGASQPDSAARALNKWAKIEGSCKPTWNELAKCVEREGITDLHQRIQSFVQEHQESLLEAPTAPTVGDLVLNSSGTEFSDNSGPEMYSSGLVPSLSSDEEMTGSTTKEFAISSPPLNNDDHDITAQNQATQSNIAAFEGTHPSSSTLVTSSKPPAVHLDQHLTHTQPANPQETTVPDSLLGGHKLAVDVRNSNVQDQANQSDVAGFEGNLSTSSRPVFPPEPPTVVPDQHSARTHPANSKESAITDSPLTVCEHSPKTSTSPSSQPLSTAVTCVSSSMMTVVSSATDSTTPVEAVSTTPKPVSSDSQPISREATGSSCSEVMVEVVKYDLESLPPIDLDNNKIHLFVTNRIGCRLTQKWTTLARFLRVTEEDIEKCKERYMTPEERGIQILHLWVSKQHSEATWKELVSWLEHIGKPDLCYIVYSSLPELAGASPIRKKVLSPNTVINKMKNGEAFLKRVSERVNEHWKQLAHRLGVFTEKISSEDISDHVQCLNAPVEDAPLCEDNDIKHCLEVLKAWAKSPVTIGMLSAILRDMDIDMDQFLLENC